MKIPNFGAKSHPRRDMESPGRRKFVAALPPLMFALRAGAEAAWAQAPKASPSKFTVFDSLLYKGKPDLTPYGLTPIAGTGALWGAGKSHDDVDEDGIRRALAPYRNSNGYFFLDIELWTVHFTTKDIRDASIAKMTHALRVARAVAPNMHLGFYGVIPGAAYWPIQKRGDQLQQWHDSNSALAPLAAQVDALFPSLYTFYDDVDGWVKYARETIAEARQYGKPVYPFLWPQFHDSNAVLHGHEVPSDFWRVQLKTCFDAADGIVIWGGFQIPWNPAAAWWQETLNFMAANNLRPVAQSAG